MKFYRGEWKMKLLYPKIVRAHTLLNKLLFVCGIRLFVFHKIIPPILHVFFSSGRKVTAMVKWTFVQALRICTGPTAHRGSRGIALLFLDHGTRRGQASRRGPSLPPGKTRYPLYRRLDGPQGRSGQVRKISPPPPGFDPCTVHPVASRYTDWATGPTVLGMLSILICSYCVLK